MPRLTRSALAALVGVALLAGSARAADLTEGMKKGNPDLQSVEALAFGPQGILFIGDAKGAAVFAVATGDTPKKPETGDLKVKGIDTKVADLLGTEAKQLQFKSLAVNPASGKAYLAIARGKGPQAKAVVLRVDRKGKVEEVPLKGVKFSKAVLPNPPAKDARGGFGGRMPLRMFSITKIAYVNGKVFVSGLSNEEWASTLRSMAFPFKEADKGANIQIFHGAHGRFETQAPIRTFVPFDINGDAHLLAAYTCTPLVKIPVSQLKPGSKVKGTTVAELGNHNSPIDMIAYEKDGKKFLLIANNARGLMKVSTEKITEVKPIKAKVKNLTAGLTYEKLKEFKNNVQQLARLDKNNVLLLVRVEDGALNLDTIPLP
jgi:hypothetical protein